VQRQERDDEERDRATEGRLVAIAIGQRVEVDVQRQDGGERCGEHARPPGSLRATRYRAGVSFAEAVYRAVRRVPPGRVATYGDIARLLGRDHGAREVGWALAACGDPRVPCHRIVDRNGRLAPHFATQRALLEDEGVTFADERVDLESHRWSPRRRRG
jgi:methylated-DNA-protein-cysteine methyltransferase-like protein